MANFITLVHGTTHWRAVSIVKHGPNPNFVEPGGNFGDPAGGLSTYPKNYPTPPGASVTDYAFGKSRLFPNEGGAVILEIDVPVEIVDVSRNDAIGQIYIADTGEIRFETGHGVRRITPSLAESHEADYQAVNTTHPIVELFTTQNLVASGIIQVTEELLGAAIDRFALVLEAIPTASGEWALYFVGEPPTRIPLARPSLFRTILARIGSIGAKETGHDVNPYGDRFTITRPTADGLVHLEVDFQNTTGLQRLRIVRVPAAVPLPAEPSTVM